MITAPELEIAVLVLGMVILMFEAFTKNIDKRFLAFAGITGLATVLVASFFVAPSQPPDQAIGFWSFYTADPLSIFFKQFALSTAFFVYGITWLFGATGETNLQRIAVALTNPSIEHGAALFGMVLVLVALGFKIAAVPFQIWVPDVYQGAPTPVTAYLSVGSKAAGFVVLLRVLRPFLILPQMQRLIVLIALLTLIYGNLAALPQGNLKRLLAYSSIAHAGYLLIGVACFDGAAVVFYLVAYLLMTLLSFAVLVIVAQQTGDRISDFDG